MPTQAIDLDRRHGRIQGHSKYMRKLAISSDESGLYSAASNEIKCWHTTTCECLYCVTWQESVWGLLWEGGIVYAGVGVEFLAIIDAITATPVKQSMISGSAQSRVLSNPSSLCCKSLFSSFPIRDTHRLQLQPVPQL